jgi:uncharacterized protein YcgI (DUF1989 family)
LAQGRQLRVTTLEGSQVVDTWALVAADTGEWLSMEHTRGLLSKVSPHAGDRLYSNRRRPVLALLEDTSPGVHDTLIAACDQTRYDQLGHVGPHRNCVDNFRTAVSAAGLAVPAVPSPLNLFMNVPVVDGGLELAPSLAARGDSVTLEALVDVVVVLSACPQDRVPINGAALTPTDIAVDLLP